MAAPDRPFQGQAAASVDQVRAELDRLQGEDEAWLRQNRRTDAFTAGPDADALLREAAARFATVRMPPGSNQPSLQRMEEDVVAFGLSLLNAPADAWGCVTSCGSESVTLALKACREQLRAQGRDPRDAEVVVPRSAHVCVDKAADLLGLRVVRIPVASDFRCDLAATEAAIGPRTAMLLGSAPCYPYGVFDDMAGLSDLAVRHGLWLHVDHCIAGYLAPFAQRNGTPIPAFAFELPGVASISADLHKFGYAAVGISTLFYRTRALYEHQLFRYADWPRDPMVTNTLAGTRSASPLASAWAVIRHLGEDGFRARARAITDLSAEFRRGLAAIPGLRVLGDPLVSVVTFTSERVPPLALHGELRRRGWLLNRLLEPEAMQLNLGPTDGAYVGAFLDDLSAAVKKVRDTEGGGA